MQDIWERNPVAPYDLSTLAQMLYPAPSLKVTEVKP
jgi:hypothetical protein